MGYESVLELPLKVFSLYNTCINRLRAEEDIRKIKVMTASTGGEALTELAQSLMDDLGSPVETTVSAIVKPDTGAFETLQSLSNLR